MPNSSLAVSASILVAATVLTPMVRAQDLYAAGTEGTLLRGHPSAGGFAPVAQCAQPIRSLCFRDEAVLVGDASGWIHRFEPASGSLTALFATATDASALLWHTGAAPGLFVAGSNGSILRVDASTGDVLATFSIGVPIRALALADNVLYAGSLERLWSIDLVSGQVAEHAVPIRVAALALDDEAWVVSDGAGRVVRLSRTRYTVEADFLVPNEATAIALHTKQLLAAGADGSLSRVDRHHGGVASTLSTEQDVRALALEPLPAPGQTYCYGDFCPCGNLDHEAGCANSTGAGALLRASGTASVAADDLFLASTQMPFDKLALFFAGAQANWIPFGDGLMCTGGGAHGPLRFPVASSGASGSIALGPGMVQHTQQHMPTAKHIFPGQTLNIQAWYRDPAGPCGSGINLSNALTVTFVP